MPPIIFLLPLFFFLLLLPHHRQGGRPPRNPLLSSFELTSSSLTAGCHPSIHHQPRRQREEEDPAPSSFQHQLSTDDFAAAGDRFGLRDPLLNELAGAAFFDGGGGEKSVRDCGGSSSSVAAAATHHHHHQMVLIGDEMKRPCSNLFSRVLQISPVEPSPLSPRAIKPLPMVAGDMVKLEHGVQISSPRTPGIKRSDERFDGGKRRRKEREKDN